MKPIHPEDTVPDLIGNGLSGTITCLLQAPWLVQYVKQVACNFDVLDHQNRLDGWLPTYYQYFSRKITLKQLEELSQGIKLINKDRGMPRRCDREVMFFCPAGSKNRMVLYRYFTVELQHPEVLLEMERHRDVTPVWEDDSPVIAAMKLRFSKVDLGRLSRSKRKHM